MRPFLIGLLLTALGVPIYAQSVPPLVTEGLGFLVKGNTDSAIATWSRPWTAPEDTLKRTQLRVGFQRMYESLGAPFAYDLIRVVELTPHLRRAYFLLRCRRQPVYLMLSLYQTQDSSWLVNAIDLNPDPDRVLPPELIGRQHQGP